MPPASFQASGAAPEATRNELLVSAFRDYLVSERGLAAGTVGAYTSRVGRFLATRGEIAGLTAADVIAGVRNEAARVSVGSTQYFAASSRAFLRFCFVDGHVDADLSDAALAITGRRRSSLPQGISADDADALLASCDRRRSDGRRDYAVLVVLLRLGLRAGEVAGLSLDDMDWRAGEITVHGKGRRVDRVPLPVEVGEAIVATCSGADPAKPHAGRCSCEAPPRSARSAAAVSAARGRDAMFWQSPRTRKQARPNVATPTARAAGIALLEVLVDTREQYPYRFASQQASTRKRALPCGDYGVTVDGRIIAVVERKSLADLVSSVINGKLRYALGDLAALPRAAVIVENRYAQVFKLDWVRPSVVADGLAELQVRWPRIPIVLAEARRLAEEWTYRYLAAAHAWASTELALPERIGVDTTTTETAMAPTEPEPTTSEVRAWARASGISVSDRGRLHADIWQAWRDAQQP